MDHTIWNSELEVPASRYYVFGPKTYAAVCHIPLHRAVARCGQGNSLVSCTSPPHPTSVGEYKTVHDAHAISRIYGRKWVNLAYWAKWTTVEWRLTVGIIPTTSQNSQESTVRPSCSGVLMRFVLLLWYFRQWVTIRNSRYSYICCRRMPLAEVYWAIFRVLSVGLSCNIHNITLGCHSNITPST